MSQPLGHVLHVIMPNTHEFNMFVNFEISNVVEAVIHMPESDKSSGVLCLNIDLDKELGFYA